MKNFTWISIAGGNWNNAANWDQGVVPAPGDQVTIPTLAGGSAIILGADLNLLALTVQGGNLILSPGATLTVTDWLALQGTISGGTLDVRGARLGAWGGTLSNVVVHGALDLSGTWGASVTFGGDTLNTVLDTGAYNRVTLAGGQTLDNVTIRVGSQWFDYLDANGSVTLGAHLQIQLAGNGEIGGGTIDNLGAIATEIPGYGLTIQPTSFTNDGLLQASNGSTLNLQPGSLTNAADGTITATGANLLLGGGFTNLGAVTVNGGSLTLQMSAGDNFAGGIIQATDAALSLTGSMTTAQFGTVLSGGGEIVSADGQTTGTRIEAGGVEVVLSGGVAGGVVVDRQGAAFISSGAVLSGGLISGGVVTIAAGGHASGIQFAGQGGLLSLGDAAGLSTTISGFAACDAIDLLNFGYTTDMVVAVTTAGTATKLTFVNLAHDGNTATVTLLGTYSSAGLHISRDGGVGTLITTR